MDLNKDFDPFIMILDHHQEPEVVVALESYPTLEGKPHSNSSAQDQVR